MYSVVVPTFNRAEGLRGPLESLLAQDTSLAYEIIVVDNNSSDETRSVVKDFEERAHGRLRYVFEETPGPSAARNAGIATAVGEVIAFMDDDAIASPGWLEAIAITYRAHPDAWCVGGKIMLSPKVILPSYVDPDSKLLRAFVGWLDLGDDTLKIEYPRDVWGANFSVKRDVLSVVGVFSPNLGPSGGRHLVGEETELCLRIHRAGGAIFYCGQAVVTHLFQPTQPTKRYFRRRAYWQGRTSAILFPHYPRRAPWRKIARLGLGAGKTFAQVLYHYGIGDVRGAFECELGAWSRLGHFQQTLLMAWNRQRHRTTTRWSAEGGQTGAPEERTR